MAELQARQHCRSGGQHLATRRSKAPTTRKGCAEVAQGFPAPQTQEKLFGKLIGKLFEQLFEQLPEELPETLSGNLYEFLGGSVIWRRTAGEFIVMFTLFSL